MKPEEQRIEIAKACGWDPRHQSEFDPLAPWGQNPALNIPWAEIPNYPNDLNAMAQAEKTLICPGKAMIQHKLNEYASQLRSVAVVNGELHYSFLATAPHRAEAFLRAIGRWSE